MMAEEPMGVSKIITAPSRLQLGYSAPCQKLPLCLSFYGKLVFKGIPPSLPFTLILLLLFKPIPRKEKLYEAVPL